MNMVSGLFKGHAINPPITRKQMNAMLDEFADWLSLDLYSRPEIARRMGITEGTACVLWNEMCTRLGETIK